MSFGLFFQKLYFFNKTGKEKERKRKTGKEKKNTFGTGW